MRGEETMKYEFDISIGLQEVLESDKKELLNTRKIKIPETVLQDKLFELRSDARYSYSELCHNLLNELSEWAEKYTDN